MEEVIHGAVFEVFSIEIVLLRYVVHDGSGLNQLQAIYLHQWNLLVHEDSICKGKAAQSRVRTWVLHEALYCLILYTNKMANNKNEVWQFNFQSK